MKTNFFVLAVYICSIALSFAQQEVKLNTHLSVVNWHGSMLFNFGEHYGTVDFKSGKILKSLGNMVGGEFTIDMNTIKNTDDEYNEDLIRHLKNQDFFEVNKYPTARLVMTKVEDMNGYIHIDANLTIKEVTKSIHFDGRWENENHFKTQFIIDRSEWNITYGARSLVNVKDHAISDAIEFKVDLYF